MKAMKNASVLCACVFAGAVAANAAVVFEDDFSYDDGTALSGQTPDVGGAWSGGGGWKANGGAVALAAGSDAVFANFTSALSEGQKLTVTFDTQEIAGFLGSSWAVVSLFSNNSELAYIGDPGGDTTYWSIGGIANVTTADSNQANTATFTYEYNTGAWTFSTNASGYSGNGTPGLAINRLRVASGGVEENKTGNMKLDSITVSIEQIAPAELKITEFTRIDAYTYRLAWSGGNGTYNVEASTDLVEWADFLTGVTSPQLITVDPDTDPKLFFRVVEPAPK